MKSATDPSAKKSHQLLANAHIKINNQFKSICKALMDGDHDKAHRKIADIHFPSLRLITQKAVDDKNITSGEIESFAQKIGEKLHQNAAKEEGGSQLTALFETVFPHVVKDLSEFLAAHATELEDLLKKLFDRLNIPKPVVDDPSLAKEPEMKDSAPPVVENTTTQ